MIYSYGVIIGGLKIIRHGLYGGRECPLLCWFSNYKVWLLRYIPDKATSKFRLTPYCIKYQDDIYCMPSYGKSVWVYNTTNYAFDEICIDNPDEISIGIQAFWIYENKNLCSFKWYEANYRN